MKNPKKDKKAPLKKGGKICLKLRRKLTNPFLRQMF
jgi:hypothetical protein